jgi:dienelactone hydrolase
MNLFARSGPVWAHTAAWAVALLLAAGEAAAQARAPGDSVTIPGVDLPRLGGVVSVAGVFGKPSGGKTPFPAVLVLHGSGGVDGRGAYHAKALQEAGIATLEIEMFTRGGRPREGTRATLPHAAAALKWLAAQPGVDPGRIGVMGFSWGGLMTVLMGSELVQDSLGSDVPKPVALAPFYPTCTVMLRALANTQHPLHGWHTRMGAQPMLIQLGTRDDYEEGDRPCEPLVAAWPEVARSRTSIVYHDGAFHGFDAQEPGGAFHDPFARGGRGGQVRFYPSPRDAAAARDAAVAFFVKHLVP